MAEKRYRSHLKSATPPTYETALAFFKTLSDNAPTHEYPMLGKFQIWLAEQQRRDTRNYKAHGATRGLVHHIYVMQNWMSGVKVPITASNERALSSTEIGIRVDDELEALFNGRSIARPHAYTVWLIMYLYERRWLPCAFQTPLWSADDKSLRTKADIIVYDTVNARFALLEQKTGYDNNYNVVMGKRSPYDYFAHTRRIVCHLQLGWMYFEMARTRHPWPLDAYVVRVSSRQGVRQPEPLDDSVYRYYKHEHTEAGTLAQGMLMYTPLAEVVASVAEDEEDDDADDDNEEENEEKSLEVHVIDSSDSTLSSTSDVVLPPVPVAARASVLVLSSPESSSSDSAELSVPHCKRARCWK